MHNPAEYIIQVVGALGEEWSGRLGGLTIATTKEAGQHPVTTLSGQLADQAALLCMLNGLYNIVPALQFEGWWKKYCSNVTGEFLDSTKGENTNGTFTKHYR